MSKLVVVAAAAVVVFVLGRIRVVVVVRPR